MALTPAFRLNSSLLLDGTPPLTVNFQPFFLVGGFGFHLCQSAGCARGLVNDIYCGLTYLLLAFHALHFGFEIADVAYGLAVDKNLATGGFAKAGRGQFPGGTKVLVDMRLPPGLGALGHHL